MTELTQQVQALNSNRNFQEFDVSTEIQALDTVGVVCAEAKYDNSGRMLLWTEIKGYGEVGMNLDVDFLGALQEPAFLAWFLENHKKLHAMFIYPKTE